MELYRTIRKAASETQVIERSKFIAHITPADTREEAEIFIDEIRNRYKDATHNVPAMVIGEGFQIQWGSDDGEPQGTSGAPMVQMLVSEGITNVVVVVTRYFGGIKLGTGGLVRAYTSSARLALDAAEICSVHEGYACEVELEYSFLAMVQKLSGEVFSIENIIYGEKVVAQIQCLREKEEELKALLMNITSGSAMIKREEYIHIKRPVISEKK